MARVVVLGGGFAGVLAACVFARHGDDVTLVEADEYPVLPGPRRGVPQAHHSHVLVTGGARALEALLPGTLEALREHGAHWRGIPGDTLVLASQGWFYRHRTDAYLVTCSRGLIDQVIRPRALGNAHISLWERTRVLGLEGDAKRVSAVRVLRQAGSEELVVEADLVVDAMGRRSKARGWLRDLGGQAVDEVTVDSGLAYATRIYQAPPDTAAEIPAVVIHPRPANGEPGRGGTLYPIEGDRWIVTLTGTRGGEPPTSDEGFDSFARLLPHPIISELIEAAEPVGRVRPYRDTSNRRKLYETVTLPDGFFAIGDSVAAVNPIHSHGMSIAALSALRLTRELESTTTKPSLSNVLQSAMVDEAETSWRMAVAQDRDSIELQHGGLRQRTAFERKLRERASRTLLSSPVVAARFFGAQALIDIATADTFSVLHEMSSADATPMLTADEAIKQYPALAKWWESVN